MAFILTLFCLHSILLVNAALYITAPSQGSSCKGGSPCTIEWTDNGEEPLLTAFGWSHVGLYTKKQQLVQSIKPVDVSATHSMTFTPIPGAGPESDAYYIAFISGQSVDSKGIPSIGFSPYFSIKGMTGSFDTPLPEATSSIPIPSLKPSATLVTSTMTVGTLSTTSLLPTIASNSSQVSLFSAIQSGSAASAQPSTSAPLFTSATLSTSITLSLPSTSISHSTASPLPSTKAKASASHLSYSLHILPAIFFLSFLFS